MHNSMLMRRQKQLNLTPINMKKTIFNALAIISLPALMLALGGCTQKVVGLKSAFWGKFHVGTSLSIRQTTGTDTLANHFMSTQYNSITAENCMKHEEIHPEKNRYNFTKSDEFVQYGQKYKAKIIGHTLVWHSQCAPWLFVDDKGNTISRDTLIARMRSHIYTVVGRYKGKIQGWDVVNEAFNDDGTLRSTPWLQIIGPEYIEMAFRFAHEADPNAELYYNDFNVYKAAKCDSIVSFMKKVRDKGVRIDAIGEQGHYLVRENQSAAIEKSIVKIADAGFKVMITELDISVLPFPHGDITAEVSVHYKSQPEYNPFRNGISKDAEAKFNKYYTDLFEVLNRHAKVVDRVTFWGLTDADSWKNNWPIGGRTDYPLLFDRTNQPKEAYFKILEIAKRKN